MLRRSRRSWPQLETPFSRDSFNLCYIFHILLGVVKIYVETYGCAANVADSEIALGLLRQAGHEFVSDPRDADVIIIFTCVVKKPTSARMLYRISKLAE